MWLLLFFSFPFPAGKFIRAVSSKEAFAGPRKNRAGVCRERGNAARVRGLGAFSSERKGKQGREARPRQGMA